MHRILRESSTVGDRFIRTLCQRPSSLGISCLRHGRNDNARFYSAESAVGESATSARRSMSQSASSNQSSGKPRKSRKGLAATMLLLTAGASSAYWYYLEHEKKDKGGAEFLFQSNLTSRQKVPELPALGTALDKKMLESDLKKSMEMANEVLENAIKSSLVSATEKVHLASEAKSKTIASINEHASVLKEAIDGGENGDWTKVTSMLESVNALSAEDASIEADARNYIDNVQKIVEQGKLNEHTHNNPLLLNANQTVGKLTRQLDELNVRIRKTRNEGRILNQYKDLIDKSRKQFAEELKSVVPNIDLHAKESKLSEEELNALIAHAHLKIDQLRKQLVEQQVQEEKNIAVVLDEKIKSKNALSNREMEIKLDEISKESEFELEKLVSIKKELWEVEMEEKLKRTAAAHAKHIEEVVKTQRTLFDIEQKQRIAEAVEAERGLHSRQLSNAQGKLEGIEAALKLRFTQDVENRRAKQLWIACQSLMGSIVYGIKGRADIEARRKPLGNELQVISEACGDDEFVCAIISSLSDEVVQKGVYTCDDLQSRFDKLYYACRKIAKMDENNVGVFHYCLSYLQNVMSLDVARQYSKMDKFDPDLLDSYEILSRARYFVNNGDFVSAVRMLNLLVGPAKHIARDWIHDARTYVEARFIADLLVTHATVSNLSSVY